MEPVTQTAWPATDRRRFLARAGLGTAALAAAVALPGRAGAQTAGGEEQTPPEQLLAFAESLELAVADAQTAIAGQLSASVADQLRAFAAHHQAHAAGLAKAAGPPARGRPNPGLAEVLGDQLSHARTPEDLMALAIDLEDTMAATHLSLAGMIEGRGPLELIATILPVEAEHAVALGLAAGRTGGALFPAGAEGEDHSPFETQRKALDPAAYPTEPTSEGGQP